MLRLRSAIVISLSVLSHAVLSQATRPSHTSVLVELFTSEGCSICPPADALLAKLDHDQPFNGVNVIVLGEHVDYWENLGWHDRFSSHQFTDRQSQYGFRLGIADIYTPQMIVDGTDQFVGNDVAHASRSIQHAAQTAKLNLSLTRPVVAGHRISSTLSSIGLIQASGPQGDIYVALVDVADTTEVRNGENRGHRLQHAGVVRSLKRAGAMQDLGQGQLPFSLDAPNDAEPANMRVVAFVQQKGQGAILGAAVIDVNP